MSWVMLRQPVYRQTCRHALATITNPSISYTKDGRWNLSMHVGERDRRFLKPFMEKYGLGDGIEEVTGEPVPGVRAVAGASSAATAGVEYVQRLTRRFRYDDVPWQEAQLPACSGRPSASRTRTRSTSTGCRAARSPTWSTRSWTVARYPVSKWISTRGSWPPGGGAAARRGRQAAARRVAPRRLAGRRARVACGDREPREPFGTLVFGLPR